MIERLAAFAGTLGLLLMFLVAIPVAGVVVWLAWTVAAWVGMIVLLVLIVAAWVVSGRRA